MRIIDLELKVDKTWDGLSAIKFHKLDKIVLLVGGNGAGKSRILRQLVHLQNDNAANFIVKMSDGNIDFTKIYDYTPLGAAINHHLPDTSNMPPLELIKLACEKDNGVNNSNTLPFIHYTQNQYYELLGDESTAQEKVIFKNNYIKLKSIIKEFAGLELERNGGVPTLSGYRFSELNSILSAGQSYLLQFAVDFFKREYNFKNAIILVDQPETHLHPNAAIQILRALENYVEDGQLWIATHSISILSQFDPNCIWYVKDGTVQHAGRKSEEVLQALLGDNEKRSKVSEFIRLPEEYAINRYATECLIKPEPITTNNNDKQIFQIKEILAKISSNTILKVLDYGAGKGRIIENLDELFRNEEKKVAEIIDYVAYDYYSEYEGQCNQKIANAYTTSNNRYYNSIHELYQDHQEQLFDVVIMCNVLHEIPIESWENIFSGENGMSRFLNTDGYLFIVEVLELPIGEKAHKTGFHVLDIESIKKLFLDDKEITFETHKDDKRLIAYRIPAKNLSKVNLDSIIGALEQLKQYSLDKIKEVREVGSSNYKIGMSHAFHLTQFANATIAHDKLTK